MIMNKALEDGLVHSYESKSIFVDVERCAV